MGIAGRFAALGLILGIGMDTIMSELIFMEVFMMMSDLSNGDSVLRKP